MEVKANNRKVRVSLVKVTKVLRKSYSQIDISVAYNFQIGYNRIKRLMEYESVTQKVVLLIELVSAEC
jgi:hypothetical protein